MTIDSHSPMVAGGASGLGEASARDPAQHGIRVCAVAPGLFQTPLMQQLPKTVQQSPVAGIPLPLRLGRPAGFAALARHIVSDDHLNGAVIRLDGARRMAPR